MPERHSTVVGGSSAARVINCPGSRELLAQVPEVANRDSFYSMEGTALHTLMEMLITGKVGMDNVPEVIETRGGPINITPELIVGAVLPAMEYWGQFLHRVDEWLIEAEVDFPGIKGAFGTADVIGRDNRENISYVSDWKFGSGKGVLASYDGVPNEQLMFYACAARNTYPEMFPDGCRVWLTIVQPRARDHDPVTSVEVSTDDLDDFEAGLQDALKATGTHPGRWCDFQACKTICPHHTGPLLDLGDVSHIPTLVAEDYMATILRVLEIAPRAEALIKEARAQAQVLLANGTDVPGWKLVAKRGLRQWALDDAAVMKQLKVKKDQFYVTEPRSPAQLEKLLRIKVPPALAPVVSSGTTLAPVSDKRPAVAADPDAISKIMVEVLGHDD